MADRKTYGPLHNVKIEGRHMELLPLAHPRQVARLAQSSARWYELYTAWLRDCAGTLL
jgi:hypothetical protein